MMAVVATALVTVVAIAVASVPAEVPEPRRIGIDPAQVASRAEDPPPPAGGGVLEIRAVSPAFPAASVLRPGDRIVLPRNNTNVEALDTSRFELVRVLEDRSGDCNEHTVLYVALARALGLRPFPGPVKVDAEQQAEWRFRNPRLVHRQLRQLVPALRLLDSDNGNRLDIAAGRSLDCDI